MHTYREVVEFVSHGYVTTTIKKIQDKTVNLPSFFFAFGMLYYLKMYFQKGVAADGRTERKEARTQKEGTEV